VLTGVVALFALLDGKKSVFAAADNRDFAGRRARIRLRRDRWIYEWGVRHTDKLVVQNREQLETCKQNFDGDAVTIGSVYSAPATSTDGPKDTVLWVSTIRSVKRPEVLIALARMLPERQFVMIGGGDKLEKRLFQEIKAMAENESNVDFVGFVPYAKIDPYFDNARIFINTSESEGFPNTFLQSWARSRPTISFIDCGAQIEGRTVGYKVETLDEMVKLVEKLFSDSEEYNRAGEICSQYCRQFHSPRTVVRQYENLFEDLLDL
jgi:glycosyltransferase involved in cell wall biosynthesis